MNKSTVALIAAAIALSIHAPGRAESGPPQSGAQAQHSICIADRQGELNRHHFQRMRKAKANLVAAAFGSRRGPVPGNAPPTQLACNELHAPQARTGSGG